MLNILITGGCGYIGSHVACLLNKLGHYVIVYDNFANSKRSQIKILDKICTGTITYVEGDVCDSELMYSTLQKFKVDAVIHMAGLKYVGDSVTSPLSYYEVNVAGTISLIGAMGKAGVKKLVFSSSATVYGEPNYLPIDEEHRALPISPYGRTKYYIEEFLKDIAIADSEWSIVCLRYFNPAGSHESGLIGDELTSKAENLFPMIGKVAIGKIPKLTVFGGYDTPDGTGIRDYIHVQDLAEGHTKALNFTYENCGFEVINLGRGHGYSVLEVIKCFEEVTSVGVPIEFADSRPGDVASSYADNCKAGKILGWRSTRDLTDMCDSMWTYIINSEVNQ